LPKVGAFALEILEDQVDEAWMIGAPHPLEELAETIGR